MQYICFVYTWGLAGWKEEGKALGGTGNLDSDGAVEVDQLYFENKKNDKRDGSSIRSKVIPIFEID